MGIHCDARLLAAGQRSMGNLCEHEGSGNSEQPEARIPEYCQPAIGLFSTLRQPFNWIPIFVLAAALIYVATFLKNNVALRRAFYALVCVVLLAPIATSCFFVLTGLPNLVGHQDALGTYEPIQPRTHADERESKYCIAWPISEIFPAAKRHKKHKTRSLFVPLVLSCSQPKHYGSLVRTSAQDDSSDCSLYAQIAMAAG